MNLGDILKTAGSAIVKTLVPGGGFIIDLVNNVLPADKKLPVDATGEQITQAIQTLPPDKQAELMSKELDVEIAEINSWTQIQGSLAEADKVGASTRPKISLMMAEIVGFVVIAFSSMWIVAIFRNQVDMVQRLSNAWPLMLTVIATPTALLRAYFGMRTKEKENRYAAAIGQEVQPMGIVGNLVKMIARPKG